MKSPPSDNFYVGYLPTPRAQRRTLPILTGAIVTALLALAFILAAAQRDPGAAIWDTAQPRTWTGVIQTTPYAVLIDDAGSALLIVEQGKHGPREAVFAPGRRAQLRGFLLERDGRRVIELDPADDAVQIMSETVVRTTVPLGEPTTLVGEVLDAKCYLGAMKPGDGKAHRACAALCIDGGIPPMLFTRDAQGAPMYYLLTSGAADIDIRDLVRQFIAEPVRVTGRTGRIADLRILALDAIERQ